MKIYTKGGDGGRTTLLGGVRVRKDDARVQAYGTVDELNSAIGLALALGACGEDDDGPSRFGGGLPAVQEDLFAIGARLAATNPERLARAGTLPSLPTDRVDVLERWIDALDEELPPLDAFVLPGGGPAGAQLHMARTVCRRAERGVATLLAEQPELGEVIVPYLNRLSDLLFTLARHENRRAGIDDRAWLPQRRRNS